MDVGFTGTRHGMTEAQASYVRTLLEKFRSDIFESRFHHGNCVGADDEALDIANELDYYTIAHPTNMPALQIPVFKSHESMNYRQPLARNRDIARVADVVIAAPKETAWPKSIRGSGTWYTIEHCRKQNVKRRCIIVWPDGMYQIEGE